MYKYVYIRSFFREQSEASRISLRDKEIGEDLSALIFHGNDMGG